VWSKEGDFWIEENDLPYYPMPLYEGWEEGDKVEDRK
jgi:hypothetical protein